MTSLSNAALERLRTPDAAAGPAIDRYVLHDAIGQGGMGTVYRATDIMLGRDVAIKVPNVSADQGLADRLRTEARVLASLEHPGIIPIHDAGTLADGRLFYVMKRVRGLTLRQHLETRPSMAERLRVFERICEPVAFAHARGIIHRDLKPDNVMVGAFGEVMVLDWGVAKQLAAGDAPAAVSPHDSAAGATQPGTVVGTLGFMPPEQAGGHGAEIDGRADVYGLGALLWFLVTGGPPPGDDTAVTSVLARRDAPKPLRAICARALAADPSNRYPGVPELAADIARYRAGEAVEAQRETAFDRAWRFARTYRTAILLVLAYIVMRTLVALLTGL